MLSCTILYGMVACLAAKAIATPLALPDINSKAPKSRPKNMTLAKFCDTYDLNDTDMNVARAAWQNTTTASWLDKWLSKHGEQDWTNNLDEWLNGESESSLDCTTVGGNCPAPTSCGIYWRQGNPQAYWVWFAVNKAYTMFTWMHEQLQNNVLLNSLQIDSMIADFGDANPISKRNIPALVSSALTLGTTATVGIPEFAAPLAVVFGCLGLAAQFWPKPIDPHAAIGDQIAQFFQSSETEITQVMDLVFSGSSGDTKQLPFQSGGYTSAISRFFADGKFLVTDVDEVFRPVVEAGQVRLRQGIVSEILRSYNHYVFVNTEVTNESDCVSDDSHAGQSRKFLDNQCFALFQFTKSDDVGSVPASNDTLTKMMTKYSFDTAEFFTNAWQCAVAHPDGTGDIDLSALTFNGTLPECFFNFGVIRGTYNHVFNDVDITDINTTGRED